MEAIDPIVFRLTIFVLAIFVGYFVVWSVTPALHTPLMSVTNAISSVIVVGALIAVSVSTARQGVMLELTSTAAPGHTVSAAEMSVTVDHLNRVSDASFASFVRMSWTSKGLGFVALILASVNIFGGFLVTARMLAMYKKKESK